ncbi:MAG: hypothetical protein H6719_35955 [Sandaracinaceae bacterium]|nr:hypothetical protein [Sandaracinaceae bacterium]
MSDEDIDETERREAEALARALDRGSADDGLPEDALQTAALLRYSAGGGELAADREDALLGEVLEAAERAARKREVAAPAATPWWRWVIGFAGLTAAIALVLFLALGRDPVQPTPLPAPSASLVSSGLGRLTPGADEEGFRAEMATYRASVYGALSARYE